MSYLLSLVVPTKNRYKYLKHLIQLIDSFNDNNIELVIQDNSDNNEEILNYLKSFNNKNIKYFYCTATLSQSENSDKAILNSTGEYVCYIGDDDGVTKYIVDVVEYMKNKNISILMSNTVNYYWPDYYSGSSLSYSGKLNYKNYSNEITTKSTDYTLNQILNKGFINRGEMPLVYHGIVRRDILDKIYEIGETFFPGPSPDIANAVSISLIERSFKFFDFPFIISGASKHHGGGIRSMKNRSASIDDVPYLPKDAKENWEERIPKVWTGETVWCESAIKALRYMKREDIIEKINFEYMYANFIAFHFPLRKLAYNLSQNKLQLFLNSYRIIVKRYLTGITNLVYLKLFGKIKGSITHKNVQDINKAVELLHNNFSYPVCIS